MKVAIIGSGNVGSALADAATRAGHQVTISSADHAAAREVATATGARLAASNSEALEAADMAIVAIPADAFGDLVAELGGALEGMTVVDVANRPTPDPSRPGCASHAEEFQAAAPTARVVKAINTVFSARQADPVVGGLRVDGYVAADDEEAKRTVLDFVESIGFEPIDVGPLAVAQTLEGMGWLHIRLASENNWSWQSAWKLIGPTAAG